MNADRHKTRADWQELFHTSTARMGNLARMKAPAIMLRGEARLMLTAEAGGKWRAIASWVAYDVATWFSYQWMRLKPSWMRRELEIGPAELLALAQMSASDDCCLVTVTEEDMIRERACRTQYTEQRKQAL